MKAMNAMRVIVCISVPIPILIPIYQTRVCEGTKEKKNGNRKFTFQKRKIQKADRASILSS